MLNIKKRMSTGSFVCSKYIQALNNDSFENWNMLRWHQSFIHTTTKKKNRLHVEKWFCENTQFPIHCVKWTSFVSPEWKWQTRRSINKLFSCGLNANNNNGSKTFAVVVSWVSVYVNGTSSIDATSRGSFSDDTQTTTEQKEEKF